MKNLQENLKKEIIYLLQGSYDLLGVEWAFSLPAERKFGDLATTLPFALAKKIKGKPFLLANDMAAKLQGQLEAVEDIRVAGGGFLNFYLKQNEFLKTYLLLLFIF